MKYIVEFEVEEGNCELYKLINAKDCESACKSCPLKDANYCMDLDMHKAKINNVKIKYD